RSHAAEGVERSERRGSPASDRVRDPKGSGRMSERMRVAVIGAGSWGTTVAALAAGQASTLLWARNAELARTIDETHENAQYLAGIPLPTGLCATASLEHACAGADVVVLGVPSHGLRAVLSEAAPFIRHRPSI